MRHHIYILSIALFAIILSGCSKDELLPAGQQPQEQDGGSSGSQNGAPVPEGYFVATFSSTATRASDFIPVEGPDGRVHELRYILYDVNGDFVKEKIVFDGGTQNWPLPSVQDTLLVGSYTAVFIGNTNPAYYSGFGTNFPAPADLITDYKGTGGYANGRLNTPYLLGYDAPDMFTDVVTFSNDDPGTPAIDESKSLVYLQRLQGGFKAYRTLVDVQEALDNLVASLVDNVETENIIADEVRPFLNSELGGVLGGVLDLVDAITLGALGLDQILDPVLNVVLDPVVQLLYDNLLELVVHEVGGVLEANNGGVPVLDLLDIVLNPWYHTDYAAVTVSHYPTQFGFGMSEPSTPIDGTYIVPITTIMTDGEEKRVVMVKSFPFGNAQPGQFVLENINATVSDGLLPWLVEGVLIDGVLNENYLLPGTLIDVEDPLPITYMPYNIQSYNEYSVVDLGADDYSQEQRNLTIGLTDMDIANLDGVLGGLITDALNGISVTIPYVLPPFTQEITLDDLLGMVGSGVETLTEDLLVVLVGDGVSVDGGLSDLSITIPVNIPLLDLSNLNISGGWDPVHTMEHPDDGTENTYPYTMP